MSTLAWNGPGGTTLLLIHGLGANGAVWEPVIESLRLGGFSGAVLAPDLAGHGHASASEFYSAGHYAATLAGLVRGTPRLVVAGHSMGAVVGLCLATGLFGVHLSGLLCASMKLDFPAAELEKLRAFSDAPRKSFPTREAASERFIKATGLVGLASMDDEVCRRGIRPAGNGESYELANDPRTVLVAGPPVDRLHALAQCPVLFACGSDDPMTSADEMQAMGVPIHVLDGAGHNPHVQQPAAFAEVIRQTLDLAS